MVVERIEGVREAAFTWREERGVVTYDTTRVSIDSVIAELRTMTGYEARREDDRDGNTGTRR